MTNETVVFEDPEGISLMKNAKTNFSILFGICLIAIVIGEMRSSKPFDQPPLTMAFVGTAALLSGAIAVKNVFLQITRMEFKENGILFLSPLGYYNKIGKRIFVDYHNCSVREWHYWKVINFYQLQFLNKGKHICNISRVVWNESYTLIKIEVAKRLSPDSYAFEDQ